MKKRNYVYPESWQLNVDIDVCIIYGEYCFEYINNNIKINR